MRFLLTRVFDYLNLEKGAIVTIKDPIEYLKRLEFHNKVKNYSDYYIWKMIKIYTDGSCLKNPGPGGWAAVIIKNDEERIISGSEKNTTNNQMELLATIKALEEFSS